jgi:hypothetical protein
VQCGHLADPVPVTVDDFRRSYVADATPGVSPEPAKLASKEELVHAI